MVVGIILMMVVRIKMIVIVIVVLVRTNAVRRGLFRGTTQTGVQLRVTSLAVGPMVARCCGIIRQRASQADITFEVSTLITRVGPTMARGGQ